MEMLESEKMLESKFSEERVNAMEFALMVAKSVLTHDEYVEYESAVKAAEDEPEHHGYNLFCKLLPGHDKKNDYKIKSSFKVYGKKVKFKVKVYDDYIHSALVKCLSTIPVSDLETFVSIIREPKKHRSNYHIDRNSDRGEILLRLFNRVLKKPELTKNKLMVEIVNTEKTCFNLNDEHVSGLVRGGKMQPIDAIIKMEKFKERKEAIHKTLNLMFNLDDQGMERLKELFVDIANIRETANIEEDEDSLHAAVDVAVRAMDGMGPTNQRARGMWRSAGNKVLVMINQGTLEKEGSKRILNKDAFEAQALWNRTRKSVVEGLLKEQSDLPTNRPRKVSETRLPSLVESVGA